MPNSIDLQKYLDTQIGLKDIDFNTKEKIDVKIRFDGFKVQQHLEEFMFNIMNSMQIELKRDGKK